MSTKPKSIAKQLDASPFAAELFAANRAQCGESVMIAPHIRDFSYAPQRFVSEAKTLARLVIYFDAAMSSSARLQPPAAQHQRRGRQAWRHWSS